MSNLLRKLGVLGLIHLPLERETERDDGGSSSGRGREVEKGVRIRQIFFF